VTGAAVREVPDGVAATRETPDVFSSTAGYAARFSGPVGEYMLAVQAAMVVKALAPFPGATVLDVGGGHGQLVGPLEAAGYRVTVLGSTAESLRRAQGRAAGGAAAFVAGDLHRLPFADRAFDVVISCRLVSHLERWEAFLTELARVAGRAVLSDYPAVAGFNLLEPVLFKLKKGLEGNTRTYRSFRRRELEDCFARAGFATLRNDPQFCLPMVLHRVLKAPGVSRALEGVCRGLGLTRWLGSPAILTVGRGEGARG
jgi:2-polyprenyl-3-methyl-5-hydroxy-6-metoxy-1,4-benzoquinol methylase